MLKDILQFIAYKILCFCLFCTRCKSNVFLSFNSLMFKFNMKHNGQNNNNANIRYQQRRIFGSGHIRLSGI